MPNHFKTLMQKKIKNYDAFDMLLMEDNPQDADLTVRALKKHNLANNLIILEDGADALDFIFCRNKFSERNFSSRLKVVLLDLKLPKVNGLEVLKILKSDEHTRMIPVVMVTSSREDPDVKEAYRLGVNSYVVKPVDFNQFMEAMSKLGLYWLLVN